MAFPLVFAAIGAAVTAGVAAKKLFFDEPEEVVVKKSEGINRARTKEEEREEYERNLARLKKMITGPEEANPQPKALPAPTVKEAVKLDRHKAKRLKDILGDIREVAGYTVAELGERISLSRQTIYNLEKKEEAELSVVNYYALMTVFAFQDSPNTKIDRQTIVAILDILVEHPENYSDGYKESTRRRLRELANEVRNPNGYNESYVKEHVSKI